MSDNHTGQGSDEIFGGYPLFLPDFLLERDRSNVHLSEFDDVSRRIELAKAVKRMDVNSAFVRPPTTHNRLQGTSVPYYMANAYPPLPLKHAPNGHASKSSRQPYFCDLPPETRVKMSDWHPFHSGQYLFTKAHLDNLILSNLGDRGEMAHSIEGRTPFLDHHLTEYANSLPPSVKIRPIKKTPITTSKGNPEENSKPGTEEYEFVEKYVLREAARPFVTDEIYRKRKHPYSAPLKYRSHGPLHQLIAKHVTEENIAQLGFLKWRSADYHHGRSLGELVDSAFADKDEAVFRLVICLAQWVILSKKFGVKRAFATPAPSKPVPALF